MKEIRFGFENLEVWQKSVDFANRVIEIIDNLKTSRNHYKLVKQLESAVTSIAMNVAEGKGRFSKKEFIQFLYIARGSLFETITLIEIFKKRQWINNEQYNKIKEEGDEIGKMISSLIKAIKRTIK
ncbi:four helix bundle protein [Candidatus Aminicenantes bacterium AC-335-K20]|jgi:four helix bundle protein|nr:four helix bundle protein [SCandidatus Aminicenantes bacterium Aminicenantia_JdfR_composite]MCP2596549.1 four helix bundle protein [Candidatus Aminicenantes bacterium AC-335-G13]MCP2598315.1 four helix bundle protein [Candidatus Aminicenantes bacterium AC-335-L06]MCP2605445.1 four helix bundle protein [Candidatus Aminicenantes bacterium AC-335-O07]MCP2606108.1 four helix bundle protein [Candidatus Aminicenantes bacterium AC-708-I09]MCP2618254.1 four helix bundle protein [Candidatus Aminicen